MLHKWGDVYKRQDQVKPTLVNFVQLYQKFSNESVKGLMYLQVIMYTRNIETKEHISRYLRKFQIIKL